MQKLKTYNKILPALTNSALALVLLVSPASISCKHGRELDWVSLKQEIRKKFPAVSQISTEELADWLEAEAKPRPVLLDVREMGEYKISHLEGALRASTEREALKILHPYSNEHPIVLYCSVGYRSSGLAERLRTRGYQNVYNLEGSIFQWANEGRPLYANGKKVSHVHPYDDYWGQLLDQKLWVDSPGVE